MLGAKREGQELPEMRQAARKFEREVQIAVVKATTGTQDAALQHRRKGTTSEGERRLELYQRLLGEVLYAPEGEWQERVVGCYDAALADLSALSDYVDAMETIRRNLHLRSA